MNDNRRPLNPTGGVIRVRRTSAGDYVAKGPLGTLRLYQGEEARLLDKLFEHKSG